MIAFTVLVEEPSGRVTYAVVASDIAEAATLAVSHVGGRGAVRAVERVAELLLPRSGH
jgi:hypothetical protein